MDTTKKVNNVIENNEKIFIIPEDDFTQRYFAGNLKILSNSTIEVCNFSAGRNGLIEVNLPNCISFGGMATGSQLRSINIPLCTNIGSSAFENAGISILSLPNCSTIGEYAFNRSLLEIIDLPVCKYLGKNCFNSNENLRYVNLPMILTIESGVFYACQNLESASFPVVTSIYSAAFTGCVNLSSLTFGSYQMPYFSSNCFTGCICLETLAFPNLSSVQTLAYSSTFWSTPIYNSTILGHYGSIYVPASMVSVLQATSGWSYFSDRITSIENLPTK